MRRWLCCACHVEEPYHSSENEHLRSPKHHNDYGYNKRPPVALKPNALKEPPSIDVPALSLDELKEKTDNFGSKALIGEGSYGRAYYATLKDGKSVAVKKLDNSAEPESNLEFLTQVSRVSKLQNDNFVQLSGYCVEGNLRILAYEFATMGSLHDVLHGRKGGKEFKEHNQVQLLIGSNVLESRLMQLEDLSIYMRKFNLRLYTEIFDLGLRSCTNPV